MSWVDSAQGGDFPLENLPLGIFSVGNRRRRAGVAIGDFVLDLVGIADLLDEDWRDDLGQPVLNGWLARGPQAGRDLRDRLQELLSDERYRDDVESELVGLTEARMHVPCFIGDYTDFYVGIHHATNVGRQFRPDNPLLPNYKYVPIGYHGRASSVRASGEPVIRPSGQRKPPDAEVPEYGPSRRLDYELELGIWVGQGNELGSPIPIGEASQHIAGYCLLNDWSARDLQAWEYQPLGPFLAKNFLTSVSAWIVSPEALAPFRKPMPPRPAGDPQPLPYLDDAADRDNGGLAVQLEVTLTTEQMRRDGASPACAVARLGRRRDVLERGADRRPSQRERLQPPAGRPDRHRHAVHRQSERTRLAARDQPGRKAADRPPERRKAQLPRGWRRGDVARLVRRRGQRPHRLWRMRRPGRRSRLARDAG